MAATDKRIDAYIARSADFAKPILAHLRQLLHAACPEVTETVKWGMPFFEYKDSLLCNMAAFKQHCSFGFWNASQMKDANSKLQVKDRGAMGNFDRITSLKDLPADRTMTAYIKEAAALIEKGVKKPAVKKAPKPELPVPPELAAALKKNKKAHATFGGFSPSHRREYIEWITEAKTDATREKRIATTVEWLEEGKQRMWKYQK
ncbi:MAG TPA: YdeI/OmpD-associated family protein [Puia sp.]|jgi:uncharacterized protein YdeI (YjbR/CyaY-like superfamily)